MKIGWKSILKTYKYKIHRIIICSLNKQQVNQHQIKQTIIKILLMKVEIYRRVALVIIVEQLKSIIQKINQILKIWQKNWKFWKNRQYSKMKTIFLRMVAFHLNLKTLNNKVKFYQKINYNNIMKLINQQ